VCIIPGRNETEDSAPGPTYEFRRGEPTLDRSAAGMCILYLSFHPAFPHFSASTHKLWTGRPLNASCHWFGCDQSVSRRIQTERRKIGAQPGYDEAHL